MGTLRLVDDCDMLPSGQLCVWTALHALGRLKERKGSLKECFEHSIPPLTNMFHGTLKRALCNRNGSSLWKRTRCSTSHLKRTVHDIGVAL